MLKFTVLLLVVVLAWTVTAQTGQHGISLINDKPSSTSYAWSDVWQNPVTKEYYWMNAYYVYKTPPGVPDGPLTTIYSMNSIYLYNYGNGMQYDYEKPSKFWVNLATNFTYVCHRGQSRVYQSKSLPPTTPTSLSLVPTIINPYYLITCLWTPSASVHGVIWVTTERSVQKYTYPTDPAATLWQLSGTYTNTDAGFKGRSASATIGNYAYFGATNGRILIVDVTDNSATLSKDTTLLTIVAGDVTIAQPYTHGGKNFVLFGTNNGVVAKFNTHDRTSSLLLLTAGISPQKVWSMIVDTTPKGPVAFYATSTFTSNYNLLIGRINLAADTFEVFDETVYTNSSQILRGIVLEPSTQQLVIGVTTSSLGTGRFIRVRPTLCSLYNCDSCSTDPYYCGYCQANDQCSQSKDCATSWTNPPLCPSVLSMNPKTGATNGGTNITFYGKNFYSYNVTNFKCRFASTIVRTTTPYAVTPVSVTCPSALVPTSTTFVEATVQYSGRALTTPQFYRYYDCAAFSCSECSTAGSECTWCYRQGGCRKPSACTGPTGTICPQLTSTSVPAVLLGNATAVTFSTNYLISGETYRCGLFRYKPYLNAYAWDTTSVSTNSITCTISQSISGVFNATIFIGTGYAFYTIAPPIPQFEAYTCSSSLACKSCLLNHPLCQYCPNDNSKCGFTGKPCQNGTAAQVSACPSIASITPSKVHFNEGGTARLAISVVHGGIPLPAGVLSCIFTAPDDTVITASASGTASLVNCTVPGAIQLGIWTVEVAVGGTAATAPAELIVYECNSNATRCTECISSETPACGWCSTSLDCGFPSSLSCAGSVLTGDNCPLIITYDPKQDTLAGNATITLEMTMVPSISDPFFCNFGPDVGMFPIASIDSGSNTVTCITPPTNASHDTWVALTDSDGIFYNDPMPFTFYDCYLQAGDDPLPRTCGECYILLGCTWCTFSCQPTSTCTAPTPTCPVLYNATVQRFETSNSAQVAIAANLALPTEYSMSCRWGETLTAATIISNFAYCNSPLGMTGNSTLQLVSTDTLEPWSTTIIPIQFFGCPQFSRCNEEICLSVPGCGWCLETGKCQGEVSCLQYDPSNIWVNETCPFIESVKPEFIQVALANFTTVPQEEIVVKISGAKFHAIEATPGKRRSAQTSDFKCLFQDNIVDAISFDPTTGEVVCIAPRLERQRVIDIAISYLDHVLNANDQEFEVVDCFSIPACDLCKLSPRCGWCKGSIACMTPNWCSLEPYPYWHKSECPRIKSFDPAVTEIAGGEIITMAGEGFLNTSELTLYMTGVAEGEIAVTYVSDTEITFTMPGASQTGTVNLILRLNGSNYLPESSVMNYINSAELNVPLTAGLSASFGIIAVGAIAALIYMKQRKVGFFNAFKLVEPDYAVIAYGNFLQQQWRWPKDQYTILEQKLLINRYFVTSIIDTTQSTEQDAVARALVYFFESHSKATEVIIFNVDKEVHQCLTENTIFRTNSMASKLFKFYSKIVGIKYVFLTLARFILELETLSDHRGESSSSKNTELRETTSKSLLTMEMEVDPNKYGEAQFADSEANLYQLILTCQKIFSTIRGSLAHMPKEFIQVFRALEYSITTKFGSEEALYKAIGGFLFLRFIGPAITAPHAYGLLPHAPNSVCQRQLVLIGKVTQALANLVLPGAKETFMLQLSDFINRNIPKMKAYYRDVLSLDPNSRIPTDSVPKSEMVKLNSMASIMAHILTYEKKIREHFPKISQDSEELLTELNGTVDELVYHYKAPKKFTSKEPAGGE